MKTTALALALAVAPMVFAGQTTPAQPAGQSTTKPKKAKKQKHSKKAPKTTPVAAPAVK